MPIKLVVLLWECLLRECRVILCSKNLGKLTSAINAALGMINPFSWQHIQIPVLPRSMLDYCTAPIPFLIGVLPQNIPEILKKPLEQVFIFNLDDKKLILPTDISNYSYFVPKQIRSSLTSSLERILRSQAPSSANESSFFSYFLFFIFLSFFIFLFFFFSSFLS